MRASVLISVMDRYFRGKQSDDIEVILTLKNGLVASTATVHQININKTRENIMTLIGIKDNFDSSKFIKCSGILHNLGSKDIE